MNRLLNAGAGGGRRRAREDGFSLAPRPSPLAPLFLLLCLLGGMFASAETANRIIAIVNDDVITEADVTASMKSLLEEGNPGDLPDDHAAQMQQAVLSRLIEQRLLLQEAKRVGVTLSSEEVMERLDEIRARVGSEELFRRSLSEAGLSEEQLKERLREQLLVQKLIDAKIRSTIMVSPGEIASQLQAHPEEAKPGDRVRASHILIRVAEQRSIEQARALIEEIRQKLVGGASFADLAKQYSEDPQADEGGDMGWVAQGQLLPELDAELFRLKPGEVSGPIQTRLGFHLLKLEERRTAASLSMLEANRAIYEQLFQQKFQAAMKRWLAELKRKAYIDIVHAS